jgi:hypothetical protein
MTWLSLLLEAAVLCRPGSIEPQSCPCAQCLSQELRLFAYEWGPIVHAALGLRLWVVFAFPYSVAWELSNSLHFRTGKRRVSLFWTREIGGLEQDLRLLSFVL